MLVVAATLGARWVKQGAVEQDCGLSNMGFACARKSLGEIGIEIGSVPDGPGRRDNMVCMPADVLRAIRPSLNQYWIMSDGGKQQLDDTRTDMVICSMVRAITVARLA
jgi:hypothetical protein